MTSVRGPSPRHAAPEDFFRVEAEPDRGRLSRVDPLYIGLARQLAPFGRQSGAASFARLEPSEVRLFLAACQDGLHMAIAE